MSKFGGFDLILFDADNTLFDFTASEREAFIRTLGELGKAREPAEKLLPAYREISHELWAFLEQGKITQAELRTERFRRLFGIAGIQGDPERAGTDYLGHLSGGTHLVDGALHVCQQLKTRGVPLGIVTNGFKRVQEPRFRASPLSEVIDWLVISEDCGVAKPDPRIFDHALERAAHSDRGTVLMVGDRLESDIQGAENAGIASCWFNPNGEANGTGIRPRFEIAALGELLS
jgi:2-haloacid dehalogenase